MSIDFKKIFKGLTIKNGDAAHGSSSKQLSLTVSSSATTNTTTTIVAAQTADRTITLPDSSGMLLTSSGSLTPDSVVVTNSSGALSSSPVTSTELESLEGITGVVEDRLDSLETDVADLQTDLNNYALITYVDENLGGFQFDQSGATTNDVVTWDGTKYILAPTDSGANTTLSNLTTPVAVNQTITPDTANARALGSSLLPWLSVSTNTVNTLSSGSATGSFGSVATPWDSVGTVVRMASSPLRGAEVISSAGQNAYVTSANNGSGDSGDVILHTGTATGIRGDIILDAPNVDVSGAKIIDVQAPTSGTDATNKTYVDGNLGGFVFDQTGAATNDVVTWDGSKFILDSSGGGGGANTTLSNLGTTAINSNLVFDKDAAIISAQVTASEDDSLRLVTPTNTVRVSGGIGILTGFGPPPDPGFFHASGNIDIKTGKASGSLISGFVYSGNINIGTGVTGTNTGIFGSDTGKVTITTGDSNTNDSGLIEIRTGSSPTKSGHVLLSTGSAGGTRGSVVVDANYIVMPITNADPSGEQGAIYYNSATGKFRGHNGSTWQDLN